MTKTIDPGTFDIHEFEHPEQDVYPVTEKEKINQKTLEGIQETEIEKPAKKFFTAIIGNVFLPGLGNILLKKDKISFLLVALNLLLLITTLSPVSFLGFVGSSVQSPVPPLLGNAILTTSDSAEVIVNPSMVPVVYFSFAIALIAWLHLAFLLIHKKT